MSNIFVSILTDIKVGFEKFFGIAIQAAQDAEPLIDAVFPGAASLYNATVAECAKAEAAAIVADKQSGSGVQKLASVVQAIAPSALAFAQSNGLSAPTTAQIETYVNGTVATLNAFGKLKG